MKTFATAINCMDGRVQIPVIDYIKNNFGVNFVDMITGPGINYLLAVGEQATMESVKKCIEISVNYHNSKLIAIIGHHDCAGNPTNKDNQINHIRTAIDKVSSWGFDAKIIGLWVDENWEVCEVA